MRRTGLKVVGVILFAVLVGGGTAWWSVRAGLRVGAIDDGPWGTNANIGATAAGPYLRAAVAISGLLALNRNETVYYTAFTDSDGAALVANCAYSVEGVDPPARWWSITAYGADHFLVPNPKKRYAAAKTNVARDAESKFTIHVGGSPRDGDWIATGEGAAPFSLTLRLYNPEAAVTEHLSDVPLPRIQREICR